MMGKNLEWGAFVSDDQIGGKNLEWGAFVSDDQIGWIYQIVASKQAAVRRYIGFTSGNLVCRSERHKQQLLSGIHFNAALQRAFNTGWSLLLKKMEAVRGCPGIPSLDVLKRKENTYILANHAHHFVSGFNIDYKPSRLCQPINTPGIDACLGGHYVISCEPAQPEPARCSEKEERKLMYRHDAMCPSCGVDDKDYAWTKMRDGRWYLKATCPECGRWMGAAPFEDHWMWLAGEPPTECRAWLKKKGYNIDD